MHDEVSEQFPKYLSHPRIEGLIDFMYTDGNGYVTVGVGIKIDKSAELKPFMKPHLWKAKKTKKGAVLQLDKDNIATYVQKDYDEVKKLALEVRRIGAADPDRKKNLEYEYKQRCAAATKLRLTAPGMAEAFKNQMAEKERFIRRSIWFRSWDSFPGDAQMVLLDLAWGAPGALSNGARFGKVNFGPLCKLCSAGDFFKASLEVRGYPTQFDERKKARETMFLNAAIVTRLKWPVTHVYYPIDLALDRTAA